MSIVVVLPAPLGPRKATISPGSMVRSRPSTAVTAPKRLVSPLEGDGRDRADGAIPDAALVGAESVMPRASAAGARGPSSDRITSPP